MSGDRPHLASQPLPRHLTPRPRVLVGARRKSLKMMTLAAGVVLRLRLLVTLQRLRTRTLRTSLQVDLEGVMICFRMFGSKFWVVEWVEPVYISKTGMNCKIEQELRCKKNNFANVVC
jgi:hypothetical protein